MFFRRTDQLFEDAARDHAKLEALLGKLRRLRAGAFIAFILVSLGLLTAFAWAIYDISKLLHAPVFDPSKSTLPVGNGGGEAFTYGLVSCIAFAWGALSATIDLDARIKMLLILRASRNASHGDANEKNDT